MQCAKCRSINVVDGVCRNCQAIADSASETSAKEYPPRQTGEWTTSAFTLNDAYILFVVLFIVLWVVGFVALTSAPWEQKSAFGVVGLAVTAFCSSAIMSPARRLTINANKEVIFERRGFRPRRLFVPAGEVVSITGSLLDLNRLRPMTVKARGGSISYLPPRESARVVFDCIIAANPRAWVSSPTPFGRRNSN
jgi:hypothetical protein